MKENSIEEDMKILKEIIKNYVNQNIEHYEAIILYVS